MCIRRNFYLCGSTLFLAVACNRVYSLIVSLLKAQEEVQNLRKAAGTGAVKGGASTGAEGEKLRALQKDYDELAKKYTATQGQASVSNKKAD